MNSAIEAAQEVKADVVVPEIYQEAYYYYQKAQTAYRLKDFRFARDYAIQATKLAEKAELRALESGEMRTVVKETDLFAEAEKKSDASAPDVSKGKSAEYVTPTDTEMSVDSYEKKMQEKDSKEKKESTPSTPPMKGSP